MFKKLLCLSIAAIMCISMFACGKDNSKETEADDLVIEDYLQFKDIEPFDYAGTDLTPYIRLGQTEGHEIKLVSDEVTEEDFQNAIDDLIDEYSYYEKITDRAVKEGDNLVVDYAGYLDGVAFQGGTTEYAEVTAAPNTGYIEGFAEAFIGQMPGTDFDFDVKFPDDFRNTDLAGKTVTFKCYIHYISGEEYIVPEFNDEFVNENFGFSSVEEFLISFRRKVQSTSTYEANTQMSNELWAKILEDAEVISYPEDEVNRLYYEMRVSYEQYAETYNTDYRTFLTEYMGMSDRDLIEKCQSYVKEDLVMYQLMNQYDVTLTDEEYDEALETVCSYFGSTKEEMLEYYGEERILLNLKWEKIMASLISKSKLVD